MADDGRARVHVALARCGVASRRAAERLVTAGRVEVNGRPATIGQVVDAHDLLEVDGQPVRQQDIAGFLLHKARGAVTTVSDPQGRPTVLDGLPDRVRLFPVGRLDLDTTGALLVTNDGPLAHGLMHPGRGVAKVYEALVAGRVSASTLRRLRAGVDLDDGPTGPARVEAMDRPAAGGTWLRVELTEGRNRQVRRMGEAVGHRVLRLHRSSYAGLGLRGLRPGAHRPLRAEEWRRLRRLAGLEPAG